MSSSYYNNSEDRRIAFRHIIRKPQDVTYKIVPYDDNCPDLDHLIPSDYDIIRMQRQSGEKDTTLNSNSTINMQMEHANNGVERICVIVEFSLPKSTYATMALRELLH